MLMTLNVKPFCVHSLKPCCNEDWSHSFAIQIRDVLAKCVDSEDVENFLVSEKEVE